MCLEGTLGSGRWASNVLKPEKWWVTEKASLSSSSHTAVGRAAECTLFTGDTLSVTYPLPECHTLCEYHGRGQFGKVLLYTLVLLKTSPQREGGRPCFGMEHPFVNVANEQPPEVSQLWLEEPGVEVAPSQLLIPGTHTAFLLPLPCGSHFAFYNLAVVLDWWDYSGHWTCWSSFVSFSIWMFLRPTNVLLWDAKLVFLWWEHDFSWNL